MTDEARCAVCGITPLALGKGVVTRDGRILCVRCYVQSPAGKAAQRPILAEVKKKGPR